MTNKGFSNTTEHTSYFFLSKEAKKKEKNLKG